MYEAHKTLYVVVNIREIFLQSDSLHICHHFIRIIILLYFLQFRIDKAQVEVKGAPVVRLEVFHKPINLRMQQFLLCCTGSNMRSSVCCGRVLIIDSDDTSCIFLVLLLNMVVSAYTPLLWMQTSQFFVLSTHL